MTVPIVISAYQREAGPDALGSAQPQYDEASLGSAEVVRESRLNTDAIDTVYNNHFEQALTESLGQASKYNVDSQ